MQIKIVSFHSYGDKRNTQHVQMLEMLTKENFGVQLPLEIQKWLKIQRLGDIAVTAVPNIKVSRIFSHIGELTAHDYNFIPLRTSIISMCLRFSDHCYAIAGPGIGKDCVFPFTDRGKTYDHCANSHPVGTPLWCKTDKSEALSENTTSYGICHSGCRKVTSNKKTFHWFSYSCTRILIKSIKKFYRKN